MSELVHFADYRDEMEDIEAKLRESSCKQVSISYDDVDNFVIKELSSHFKSRLNIPTPPLNMYWTFIRVGKITFNINGRKLNE